ncbi:transcription termination factor lodestar isoform X2 [Rhodnius prolixus]
MPVGSTSKNICNSDSSEVTNKTLESSYKEAESTMNNLDDTLDPFVIKDLDESNIRVNRRRRQIALISSDDSDPNEELIATRFSGSDNSANNVKVKDNADKSSRSKVLVDSDASFNEDYDASDFSSTEEKNVNEFDNVAGTSKLINDKENEANLLNDSVDETVQLPIDTSLFTESSLSVPNIDGSIAKLEKSKSRPKITESFKRITLEQPIAISSEDEIDIKEISSQIVSQKVENLKAERKRLQLAYIDVKSRLGSLKEAAKSMEMSKLPDKGARLRRSLEKSANEEKEINERISFVDSQLKSASVENPKKQLAAAMNHLPTTSLNLSDLGKKALETHNAQSTLTMAALESLHKSLESQPKTISLEPSSGLKVSLLPHQKHGLGWAVWRESQKPAGGILADDMGLGKTLSMISLVLQTKLDKKRTEKQSDSSEDEAASSRRKVQSNATLVITPTSVMGQWENEVKSKISRGTLTCMLYHGPFRKKTRSLSSYDIVITSYSTVQREEEDCPLMKIRWQRIILDEAHTIRNARTKTAQVIFKLKSRARWALTGTPVHNKELDLFSLLKFLRCKPFDDFTIWKKWVDNKDAAGVQRLNCILKAILLRRTKEGIQSEGGLKSLKPKTFKTIKLDLDPEEYDIYKKIAYFSRTLLAKLIYQKAEKENLISEGIPHSHRFPREEIPFKEHPELAALYKDMMSMQDVKTHHILVLLLRLRQICCHPALAVSILSSEELNSSGIEEKEADAVELVDRIRRMSIAPNPTESAQNNVFSKSRCSSKMRAVIDCLTEILHNSIDDKIVVVSQWTSVLKVLKDLLTSMNIKTVEFNGTIPIKERPQIIEDFNQKATGPMVMLLSLAAGGTGLNLIGANHLLVIDIHWNPQLEAQACDRVYRVGQQKQVHIYKFVCNNTIEENILQLQTSKLELAKDVLAGSVKNAGKLTMQDLKTLFNVR